MSSKGHLFLASELLDVDMGGDGTGEVALHVGTLFAVLFYMRRDLQLLLRSLAGGDAARAEERRDARGLLLALVVASLPAAAFGLGLKDYLEPLYNNLYACAIGFLVAALVLFASRCFEGGEGSLWKLTPARAFAIGCAQSFALLPGISRSATTIVSGMAVGLKPGDAGRFSFLLALPVTAGAILLKARDIGNGFADRKAALAIGIAAAFVSGMLALGLLTFILRQRRLSGFGYYMVPLALFTFWVASRG